jgi:RimJ/RimL family protein N-acetyltransferase
MSEYFLQSDQIGWRIWTPADAELAWELWGDPEVTRLIGGPFTREQVAKRLAREIATQESEGIQYWPIFLLEGDVHIGCAGLRPYMQELHTPEFGVHLKPQFRGKGYAVEAGEAVLGYAFIKLDVHAVFAGHHPANQACRRMLRELRFRYTHDQLYAPTGLLHPSYLYARPQKPTPRV